LSRTLKIIETKKLKYGQDMTAIYEKQKTTVSGWSTEKKEKHRKNLSAGIKQSRKKDPSITNRAVATKKEKYNWPKKMKQGHLARSSSQVESANQKRKETCNALYGVDCFAKTEKFKKIYQYYHEKRSFEEKEKIIAKCIETKIYNNTMLSPNHPERSSKKLYKNACRIISEKWAEIKFTSEELSRRGLNGTNNALQLDHIVSLETCFRQGIPSEIAGHWVNLRLITWEENIKKKQQIT